MRFPWTKSKERFLIIDGDQYHKKAAQLLKLSEDCRKSLLVWTNHCALPKALDCFPGEIATPDLLTRGKEASDKYIAIRIQKLVAEGYRKFRLASGDFDMYEIAKLITYANPELSLDFEIMFDPTAEYSTKKYNGMRFETLEQFRVVRVP